MTVNLTAMLVLATLFITINAELPTSSTIKWIDIWMLFALSFPFMEVILHTAMEWMVQKKSGSGTDEKKKISATLFSRLVAMVHDPTDPRVNIGVNSTYSQV